MARPRLPKRILILGGGFGGVRAALDLHDLLPPEDHHEITLVDARDEHIPQWELYELATAVTSGTPRAAYESLRETVAVPFELIFRRKRIRHVRGRVQGMFLREKRIAVDTGAGSAELLPFDYCIVALGSETNYFGIPGLAERSYGLKNLDDAFNLRAALSEWAARVATRGRATREAHAPRMLVMGGGGFTGVELAGELAGYLPILARSAGLSADRLGIIVLEAGPALLSGARPWIVADAERRLTRLGVKVRTGAKIERFDGERVWLAGGETLPADLLVWTAGVRGNTLLEQTAHMELVRGCMSVDARLHLLGHTNVYGVGDAVYCFDEVRKVAIPPTAQRAIDQARVAAANIAAHIAGERERPFFPRDPIFVVPVGGKFALAQIANLRLSGRVGWWLKMLVGLKYLLSILPAHEAFARWRRGVALFIRND